MVEGYLKERTLDENLDMWLTDGIPPEVREWVEKQQVLNEMEKFEKRRSFTDKDIRASLINQFKKLNTEKLNDEDKTRYAELMMKYGL